MRAYLLSLAVRTRLGIMQSVSYVELSDLHIVDWSLEKRDQLHKEHPGAVVIYYKTKDITDWVKENAGQL